MTMKVTNFSTKGLRSKRRFFLNRFRYSERTFTFRTPLNALSHYMVTLVRNIATTLYCQLCDNVTIMLQKVFITFVGKTFNKPHLPVKGVNKLSQRDVDRLATNCKTFTCIEAKGACWNDYATKASKRTIILFTICCCFVLFQPRIPHIVQFQLD